MPRNNIVVIIDDLVSELSKTSAEFKRERPSWEVITRLDDDSSEMPYADVFLVDYGMFPTGPVLIKTLRAMYPDSLIIGWTGEYDDVEFRENKEEFINAGANLVSRKKWSLSYLVKQIEDWFSEKK